VTTPVFFYLYGVDEDLMVCDVEHVPRVGEWVAILGVTGVVTRVLWEPDTVQYSQIAGKKIRGVARVLIRQYAVPDPKNPMPPEARSLQTWEYQTLATTFRSGLFEAKWEPDLDLNEVAKQGWELVQIVPLTDSNGRTRQLNYVFKRAKILLS
jgi:hypothetical protein